MRIEEIVGKISRGTSYPEIDQKIKDLSAKVQKHQKIITSSLCAASTLARIAMPPLKTIRNAHFGVAATKNEIRNPTRRAIPKGAYMYIIPAAIATLIGPSRFFLPLAVGSLFGNLLIRQVYNIKLKNKLY